MPGRAVAGFAFNTAQTNSFINENPKVYFTPYHFVNDIRNIAANDNMISINTSISIDLTGQLCSESIGYRQFSGSGGQVDYIRGATLSKGGKSFIAVSSMANTKERTCIKNLPQPGTGKHSDHTQSRNYVCSNRIWLRQPPVL